MLNGRDLSEYPVEVRNDLAGSRSSSPIAGPVFAASSRRRQARQTRPRSCCSFRPTRVTGVPTPRVRAACAAHALRQRRVLFHVASGWRLLPHGNRGRGWRGLAGPRRARCAVARAVRITINDGDQKNGHDPQEGQPAVIVPIRSPRAALVVGHGRRAGQVVLRDRPKPAPVATGRIIGKVVSRSRTEAAAACTRHAQRIGAEARPDGHHAGRRRVRVRRGAARAVLDRRREERLHQPRLWATGPDRPGLPVTVAPGGQQTIVITVPRGSVITGGSPTVRASRCRDFRFER